MAIMVKLTGIKGKLVEIGQGDDGPEARFETVDEEFVVLKNISVEGARLLAKALYKTVTIDLLITEDES